MSAAKVQRPTTGTVGGSGRAALGVGLGGGGGGLGEGGLRRLEKGGIFIPTL